LGTVVLLRSGLHAFKILPMPFALFATLAASLRVVPVFGNDDRESQDILVLKSPA